MLNFAIIGAGASVFRHHRAALEKLPGRIVALADVNTIIGKQRAHDLGCAFYTKYQTMLREMRPDVAVILTPPSLHASITIACLHAGCHVLVEKPMALEVREADAMIEVAAQCQRMLGVVFQQRFRPEVRAAKALLEQGQIGEIQHVELAAYCPRPAAYYQDVSWRGTWAGEGGGVIMNQAPHHLDLLCYLVGMPSRISAWTRHLLHPVETEDTVQAMLEWPNGALGSFCASTAWAGGNTSPIPAAEQDTIKIIGTAGSLLLQNGDLTFLHLDKEIRQFVASERLQSFPVAQRVALPIPPGRGDHLAVYRHFCDALQGKGPAVTGEEARKSLEVANGLIYSGKTNQVVELPLDRDHYAQLLHALQQRPTTLNRQDVSVHFAASGIR